MQRTLILSAAQGLCWKLSQSLGVSIRYHQIKAVRYGLEENSSVSETICMEILMAAEQACVRKVLLMRQQVSTKVC